MHDFTQREHDALDHHITGNYGEDQFTDDEPRLQVGMHVRIIGTSQVDTINDVFLPDEEDVNEDWLKNEGMGPHPAYRLAHFNDRLYMEDELEELR